jgi:Tfp pilus assembly protein PilN
MLKINLLPERRAHRGADPARPLLAGVLGLAVAAAAVALFVDHPRRARLAELAGENQVLRDAIRARTQALEGYAELKQASDEADERYRSIRRLLSTTVVPANVLHELGEILTTSKRPTMAEDMIQRTSSDPNKRFQGDWDASHVWLTRFSDTGGQFTIEGGAHSESDVTQLAKRLAASVYFSEVTPAGGERIADSQTGASYVKFTITGKVAY